MLVAADHVGQFGQRHRALVCRGREAGQCLFDQRGTADQRPLEPAQRRSRTGRGARAAQPPAGPQQPVRAVEPAPQPIFFCQPSARRNGGCRW
ncbi:MAG: hypothetical protein U0Z44_16810 [Kouleothrix sp.]